MDIWTVDERKQFGKRLAEARDRAKMTQTDVADIFEIKKAAVSAWERGRNMPTVDRVAVMAAEFKVSVEWLITGAESAWPFGPGLPISTSPGRSSRFSSIARSCPHRAGKFFVAGSILR